MTRRPPRPPDPAIIAALCRGSVMTRTPTPQERVEAFKHLARYGYSDPQIAARINRSVRTVLRWRRRYQIPALPVGTNRVTRPRQDI